MRLCECFPPCLLVWFVRGANALLVAGSEHFRFRIYELGGFQVVIRFRWTENILSTGYRLEDHI